MWLGFYNIQILNVRLHNLTIFTDSPCRPTGLYSLDENILLNKHFLKGIDNYFSGFDLFVTIVSIP